jgi:hypothetical protein
MWYKQFVCASVRFLDSGTTDVPSYEEMSVCFGWLLLLLNLITEFKLGTNSLLTPWVRVLVTNLLKFPDLFRILVFITN